MCITKNYIKFGNYSFNFKQTFSNPNFFTVQSKTLRNVCKKIIIKLIKLQSKIKKLKIKNKNGKIKLTSKGKNVEKLFWKKKYCVNTFII